jgi:hypothetical protein
MFKGKVNARTHAQRTKDHDISPAGLWPVELKIKSICYNINNLKRDFNSPNALSTTILERLWAKLNAISALLIGFSYQHIKKKQCIYRYSRAKKVIEKH